MAAHGVQAHRHDEPGGDYGRGNRRSPGHAAPSPLDHPLRGGVGPAGEGAPPFGGTGESSSSSAGGAQPGIPCQDPELRSPGGCEPATWECARPVSRLPTMRTGVQSPAERLPSADLGPEDPDLPGARQARAARRQGEQVPGRRRQGQANFNRRGIHNKLARLLLVLSSCLYGSSIQRLPTDDLATFNTFGGDRRNREEADAWGNTPGNAREDALPSVERRPGNGHERLQWGLLKKLRAGQRWRMVSQARNALEASRAQRELVEQAAHELGIYCSGSLRPVVSATPQGEKILPVEKEAVHYSQTVKQARAVALLQPQAVQPSICSAPGVILHCCLHQFNSMCEG